MQGLQTLRHHLASGATLLLVEYALDSAEDRRALGLENEYQAFRPMSEWSEALRHASFQIRAVERMAHPVFCPSAGFLSYRRSVAVRLASRFKGAVSCRVLRLWAGRFIQTPVQLPDGVASPLKLIHAIAT